jgi:hypothetical protein
MCRGDNLPEGQGFLSLIPDNSETDSERPSFPIYIPQTVAQNVFFSLRDDSEDYSYETEGKIRIFSVSFQTVEKWVQTN